MGVGISGSSSAKYGNLLCLIIDSGVVWWKASLVMAENNAVASPLDWAATTTQRNVEKLAAASASTHRRAKHLQNRKLGLATMLQEKAASTTLRRAVPA